MMHFLTGDATAPVKKNKNDIQIIVHIVNNKGKWGKGFVVSLSKRFPGIEKKYFNWYEKYIKNTQERELPLGEIQMVRVNDTLFVSNMVAQRGMIKKINPMPVKYSELQKCLLRVRAWAKKYVAVMKEINKEESFSVSIHMPFIGSGLGGGDWNIIEQLVLGCLSDMDVYVYSLKSD